MYEYHQIVCCNDSSYQWNYLELILLFILILYSSYSFWFLINCDWLMLLLLINSILLFAIVLNIFVLFIYYLYLLLIVLLLSLLLLWEILFIHYMSFFLHVFYFICFILNQFFSIINWSFMYIYLIVKLYNSTNCILIFYMITIVQFQLYNYVSSVLTIIFQG